MATVTSSVFDDDFKAYMTYSTSSTNTTYSVTVTSAGVYIACSWASYPWKTTLSATSYDTRTGTLGSATRNQGYHGVITTDKTYSWTRKTSAYSVTIKVTTKKNTSDTSTGTKSVTFTVPALTKYTITYNANGGSGAPGATYKYYGKTATLSSTKPTRTGYTFKGWSTSSSATSATWAAGGSYTTNASDTLYAVWEANTYTITLNANGGTNGSTTSIPKKYGESVTLPVASKSPTRSGWTLIGWSTSKTATSATWSVGGTFSTNITSATTLYAIWRKTITLSYNVNGGSGSIASQSATIYNATTSYTFTLSSTKPTQTNHVFLGWATSSTATAPSSSISNGKITVSSSTTLYAVWKLNYIAPTVKITAKRVSISEDNRVVEDDEGVKGIAIVTWKAGVLGGEVQDSTIVVEVKRQDTDDVFWDYSVNVTEASGTLTTPVFDLLDENGTVVLSTETQYDIKAIVSDTNDPTHYTPATTFISKAKFVIDINKDGTGIAFGAACSRTGLTTAWNTYIDNGKAYYGTFTNGEVGSLAYINSSDNTVFGYGGYISSIGRTNIYGNAMSLNSNAEINLSASTIINANTSIYLTTNRTYLMGKSTGGTSLTLIGVNTSDAILVGYGSYDHSIGSTQLYGNQIDLYSRDNIHAHQTFVFTNGKGIRTYLADGTTSAAIFYTSTSNNLVVGSTTGINNMYLYTKNFTLRLCAPDSGSSNDGYFYPVADNTVTLGTTSHRWTRVYAGNSSISTSDRRQKENIKPLGSVSKSTNSSSTTYSMRARSGTVESEQTDIYSELFDKLEPVEYNMIDGEKRKNFGLIAQDVIAAMEELGIEENELDLVHHEYYTDEETGEEKDTYGMAYENLIALLIHEVQKLKGVNNEG